MKRTSRQMVKEEKKDLKKLGAKPTPNSGATPGQRADGVILGESGPKWRIEHKSTEKSYFRITKPLIQKLLKDTGKSLGGDPVLLIHFVSDNKKLILVPEWAYYLPDARVFRTPYNLTPDDRDIIIEVATGRETARYPDFYVLPYEIGKDVISS